jgi:hypothetical protein
MNLTRELLSEVLQVETDNPNILNENTLAYGDCSDDDGSGICKYTEINIYELAHKCKEWAGNKDILIDVKMNSLNSFSASVQTKQKVAISTGCYGVYEYFLKHQFAYSIEASTEPEAVFKACQWIFRNKKDNT